MKIIISVQEAIDKDIWTELCAMKSINVWAINEGLADGGDSIELTEEEAEKLRLING